MTPNSIDRQQRRLLTEIQNGLPLVKRPYAEIGARIGMNEKEVINAISDLIKQGVIKRHGVVVRHHELGYRTNAMVVWDIPDDLMDQIPHQMKQFPFITLCYRRPRRLPVWPYNLFCMIHGRDRESVLANLDGMIADCGWHHLKHEVLFSRRRFKQRGARYIPELESTMAGG